MRIITTVVGTLALVALGGCPGSTGNTNDNGSQSTPATEIIGSWGGTGECTSIQTLGSVSVPFPAEAQRLDITIAEDGRPAGVPIPGFLTGDDLVAAVALVGDSVTVTSGGGSTTHVVTVTDAEYTSSSFVLTLDIEYSRTEGNLTETGTATATVSVSRSGDAIEFEVMIDYDVTQSSGDIELETGEQVTCTGTLTLNG